MSECCCDDIIIEVNEEGIDGVGIASIELVSTVGITKNYRINLTNGTYFDYSISDGSSIASISKTSSVGLVDTYTVLLTSGETSTFEVTNGNGISSITKTSTDNLTDTYTISYTNGTTSTFSVTNGNSIASVSKVSTQVLTDTYQITYTDEGKSPDSFTVVNGRGITSIAKTSTSGLVDTYTITYNDSSTSTFTVTNGMPATHEWNGTVLTITSASGTSSADLKGDKGDAATIAVGTVTTTPAGTNATITNSGDEHDAVFDFTIPRGNTGNGIASITLQSTSGLVKTYRVTYTDGEHYDFNVADGNGIASISILSESGATKTYRITFTDGTHFDYDVVDGSDEWGAIVGNLSDQTDLQNALDSKAPAITETASGSIASFTDGSALPVEDLSVSIEPVQDLHGYDNPWPAGGGKNLLKVTATTQTINGVTFTVNRDSSGNLINITVNGTATANCVFRLGTYSLTAGTYTLNGCPSSGSTTTYYMDWRDDNRNQRTDTGSGNTFTSEGQTGKISQIIVISGTTLSNMIFKPMIRLASVTDDTYAPYSNVCPISGWDEAVVTRTGRNLLPKTSASSQTVNGVTYTVNDDGTVTINGTATANSNLKIFEDLSYNNFYNGMILSGCPSNGSAGTYFLRASDVDIASVNDTGNGSVININQTGKIAITIQVRTGAVCNNVLFKPMIRLASDPDDTFEPYQGTSVTIDLNGTRYGGTLDVTTGEMVVDRAYVEFDGSEDEPWERASNSIVVCPVTNPDRTYGKVTTIANWLKSVPNTTNTSAMINNDDNTICQQTTGTYIRIMVKCLEHTSDLNAWLAYLSQYHLQVCYELAQPVTIQLTPSTLSTLLGENHVWADTGDVEITYRADTKLFIQESLQSQSNALKLMLTPNVETEMVASQNYTLGSIVIVNNDFLKLTSAVASGANLVIGSNCVKTTMAEWVASLTA